MTGVPSLIAELKRRNAIRVAGLYLIDKGRLAAPGRNRNCCRRRHGRVRAQSGWRFMSQYPNLRKSGRPPSSVTEHSR